MPDISTLPEVTETQLDTDGTFGVGYTEGGEKKTGKLTWATLKTRLKNFIAPKTWVGNRRQNATALTVNTHSGYASLLTNSITPSKAGALIRVRGAVYGDLTTAPATNGRITFYARYKVGTGNYRGFGASSADRTYLSGHISKASEYFDWVMPGTLFEFLIEAPGTDAIKVNIEGKPRVSNTDQSSLYMNRNANDTLDGEMVSFLELTEYKASDSDTPIRITTVSAADSS